MPANADPLIYHITHIDNLTSIARSGLWSDTRRRAQQFRHTSIAHSHIKSRRAQRAVLKYPGGVLSDYVPFNFCNRSVMLYPVSQGNTDHTGPQNEIVHLVSSVMTAVASGRPWAFTDRHAELGHAAYYTRLVDLNQLDWNAIGAQQWGGPTLTTIKECKQAEFLTHDWFPWTSITQVGVMDCRTADRVKAQLGTFEHKPHVTVQRPWYY